MLSLLLGAFGLYAFSGLADHDAARVAICERHISHYGEDWWFLSYLGWAHTEAGHLGIGRGITERSLRLRPENANAAHGLSHAQFEQGDTCLRAGYGDRAKLLISGRLHRRPSARDAAWSREAERHAHAPLVAAAP